MQRLVPGQSAENKRLECSQLQSGYPFILSPLRPQNIIDDRSDLGARERVRVLQSTSIQM